MTRKIFTLLAPFAALAIAGACADNSTPTDVAPNGASFTAYANVVTFSGQGLIADGFGGYALRTEICGLANGADVDGPYLLWVLTATGATHADIDGPWGTAAMTKTGNGTFKYVSAWYAPGTLAGTVKASYDGKSKNAQLVISHGCRPTGGGWCSPGFWMNATDAAWALTGHTKSELFNTTVFPFWYGATFVADPTLETVLNNAPTYSGPPNAGTSGYALNAFNAVGAMLTDALPGVDFDFNVMQSGASDSCPIDHFGNFK
ncbi:MAG TPA: hypothetical protein VF771_18745 [Longimicrobiaceae bacterium]